MASDQDIWASALILVKEHGKDAESEAARRADQVAANGDMAGQKQWLRVMAAVKWLQSRREKDPSGTGR